MVAQAKAEIAAAGPSPAPTRFGPTIAQAVPKLSDGERTRRLEQKRRERDEWIARKRAARAQSSAQDPPPAADGSDEIARE